MPTAISKESQIIWKDCQDAWWGHFFTKMGWDYEYVWDPDKDGRNPEIGGPNFRLPKPDGSFIEAWTIEDMADYKAYMDDSGFRMEYGSFRKCENGHGVLLLPVIPAVYHHSETNEFYCAALAWYLPPKTKKVPGMPKQGRPKWRTLCTSQNLRTVQDFIDSNINETPSSGDQNHIKAGLMILQLYKKSQLLGNQENFAAIDLVNFYANPIASGSIPRFEDEVQHIVPINPQLEEEIMKMFRDMFSNDHLILEDDEPEQPDETLDRSNARKKKSSK
jgi:hypothetical protein